MKKLWLSIFIVFCLFINLRGVSASINTNTYYNVTMRDLDIDEKYIYGNVSFKSYFDNLIALQSETYDLNISISITASNTIDKIYVFLIQKNVVNYISTYVEPTRNFYFEKTSSMSVKKFNLTSFTEEYATAFYNKVKDCMENNTCSIDGSSISISASNSLTGVSNIDNISVDITFPNFTGSQSTNNFLMYASSIFLYTEQQDSNYYVKKVKINNVELEGGDDFPSYYDIFYPYTPEPEPEPEPEPTPEVSHNIMDKIYWFYDNSNEYGVLVNIYIVLFIYVMTYLISKVIILFKNGGK